MIAEAGKVGDSLTQDLFREEYILNNATGILFYWYSFTYSNGPYISTQYFIILCI